MFAAPRFIPARLADIDWRPTVGDPTVIDWIITGAYFVAAGFCLRAWWQERRAVRSAPADPRRRVPTFWLLSLFAVAFLGVNKQLDFQTLLTQVGRETSERGGWFEHRRAVQKWFLVALGGGTFITFGLLAWWLRRAWKHYLWALAGLATLAAYVLIRASLFEHHSIVHKEVDTHQSHDALLELAGDLLVCVGAWRAIGSANAAAAAATKPQAFERVVRVR